MIELITVFGRIETPFLWHLEIVTELCLTHTKHYINPNTRYVYHTSQNHFLHEYDSNNHGKRRLYKLFVNLVISVLPLKLYIKI